MLRLESLIVRNFGPYYGEQEIKFAPNGVVIIWGENGRGKTTLLNAFRYALFGQTKGRHSKDLPLHHFVNTLGKRQGQCGFSVSLKFYYEEDHYELTRAFEPVHGSDVDNDYEDVLILKQNQHVVSSAERDYILARIMPQQVARFFLFDGELLQEYEELMDDNSAIGYKIKESIESILGVPILQNAVSDLELVHRTVERKLVKAASANEKTKTIASTLEQLLEMNQNSQKIILELEQKIERLKNKKSELEDDLRQNAKFADLLLNKKRIEEKINGLMSRQDKIIETLCDLHKTSWKWMLSQRIKKLIAEINEEIDDLQAKEARLLLQEERVEHMKHALETGTCPTCGRAISSNIASNLRDRLTEMKDSVTPSKMRLEELLANRSKLKDLIVDGDLDRIKKLETEYQDNTVELADLRRQLEDVNSRLDGRKQKHVSQITKEYARVGAQIEQLKSGLQTERDRLRENETLINSLYEKLEKANGSESLEIVRLHKAAIQKIRELFEMGVEHYRSRLKNKVQSDATRLFTNISNEPEYTDLRINSNYGLEIVHSSGQVMAIRSAGYEHLVALSLVGALHRNAPMRGPAIIDSPFGRLDLAHTYKVTEALPELAEQVILLVYKSEIDCQRVRDMLGANLKKEYELQRISALHTRICAI